MITAFAGSTAPANWQLCYGQTLSRTTYAALFAVISTTYNTGGEAGTDFRLPDLRGRTVAGLDDMGGTDANRLSTANVLGTTTGAETVTLTSAQSGVPAHSHPNSASFTGTAANHNHTQDAHNHTQDAHNHTQNAHGHSYRINIIHSDGEIVTAEYLGTGLGYGSARRRYADSVDGNTATNNSTTATNQSTTATNQSTSITPAGAVTMNNQSNTAANAVSATNIMQPTMTINYIILAGV
jgi:microcystin-dependent protein